jgi:uncharacterized repeat protein (TIGR01451 family)
VRTPLRLLALAGLVALPLTVIGSASAGAAARGRATPESAALADMAISMTANPPSVSPGQNVDFKSIVTNNGPSGATGAFSAEDVPGIGSYVSVTTSQGTCSTDLPAVECDLGAIASGDSVVVDLIWSTPSKASSVTNDAHVGALQEDPNPENNEASATSEPCGTDCTGGWLADGGRVDGPPVGGDVTQSADILAPPGVKGPVSSVNTSQSPCTEPPGFDPYGEVFVLQVPAATGKHAYTFRLTLVTSEDTEVGVPPHEPLKRIEVIRGCVEMPRCLTQRHNLTSIPKGAEGCIFKVHRSMRTKNVTITTLDTGQDPPIRGGG